MNPGDAQHTSEQGAGLAARARRLITRSGRFANHARRLPRLWSLGGLVVHGLPPGGLVHRPLGALDPCSRRVLRCAAAPIRDDRGALHRRGHPVRNGGGRRLAHAVRRSRARCPRRRARTRSGGGTRGKGDAFPSRDRASSAIARRTRATCRTALGRRGRARDPEPTGGRREYADTCCEGNDYFSFPRTFPRRSRLAPRLASRPKRGGLEPLPALVDRSRST